MSDSAPPHSIPVPVPPNVFHEFAYIVGKLKIHWAILIKWDLIYENFNLEQSCVHVIV